MKLIVAITGASGSIYGWRLLQVLAEQNHEVHAIVSEQGWQVLDYECGVTPEMVKNMVSVLYNITQLSAPIASGSFRTDAMVITPCSMRTLGALANGISDNLITRSADVMLKENRRLIVVPRETPLNIIHLKNMLNLAQAGAHILPGCPGFYHKPSTINEVVDMLVGKICDMLAIEHQLYQRWQDK